MATKLLSNSATVNQKPPNQVDTTHCTIDSTDSGVLVYYTCDYRDPLRIAPNGKDVFIQYCGGCLKSLLNILHPTEARYILFQRNNTGRVRRYHYNKLHRRLSHRII